MSSIFLLLGIIVVAAIVILAILKTKVQGGSGDEAWPFYAKKPLSHPSKPYISVSSKRCPNILSSRKFNCLGCSE